jgi:phosphoribosylformimino-5-aminoimidazole carboxamide ribotide isomerase
MILYPAIDIKNNECVRLKLGRMDQSTIYNKNPVDQAIIFERLGFDWLHVVDLDAAVSNSRINIDTILEIVNKTKMSIQLGGGIRDIKTIEFWLNAGVDSVILGTAAVNRPDLVIEAAKNFTNSISIALDSRDGNISIEGWEKSTNIKVEDLAKKYCDLGIRSIIHTDINRDGILKGLNIAESRSLANSSEIPVVVSGGLKSIEDIKNLMLPENKILMGAIMGRALYDKKIDPLEALNLVNDTKKDQ